MGQGRVLSRQPVIDKDALREIAESRIREAEVLLRGGHHAAAIYLAGYAVECYLKLAVCTRLSWDTLLATFRVHDLEGLLLYSGFDKELRADERVIESFAKMSAIWRMEGTESVRYRKPGEFDESTAKRFLEYVCDPETGVVPWLRSRVS